MPYYVQDRDKEGRSEEGEEKELCDGPPREGRRKKGSCRGRGKGETLEIRIEVMGGFILSFKAANRGGEINPTHPDEQAPTFEK